ncbi:MAG: hypothetical protein Q8N83_03195 [Ignavibacteria bacterium]|nr:hypothetical protein [Ignavibacteria bacterium]
MDNLLKQLQQLFYSNEKWNYYNLVDLPNPFTSPEFGNSKIFVKEFLDYSNKTKDIYDFLELIKPDRNLHIVTDYFLGILLYENNTGIRIYIDHQIKNFTSADNNSADNSFKYFWFLICFYHDVGYYFEKNIKSIGSLNTLEDDLKIGNKFPTLLGVPKLYNNVHGNYLKYRIEVCKVYDHGIVGGMLIYDRLIKIYNDKKNMIGQNSFTFKNLIWSESMLKYFQLIASVILTHNIWFKNEKVDPVDEIILYKKYKLDKLIISDSKRIITLKRFPLLFLLSLVDSIEPTKCYGVNFLNKISFDFSVNSKMVIYLNCNIDNEVDNWFNKITSLNSWLNIRTNVKDNSYIEIFF